MKCVLNKEHHCYKILTLLMKSSAYLFFFRQTPIWATPSLLQENLEPPFLKKISTPIINKGLHTMMEVKMSSILILILIFFNNIILFSSKLINLLLYCQKNIRYTDASPTLERLEQIILARANIEAH